MYKTILHRYLLPTTLVAGVVIACGERDADAQDPVPAASQKVVVMNTSGEAWAGMTVLVDGVPACSVAELAAGGTVTVHEGKCETKVPEEAQPAAAPVEPAPAEAAPVQAAAPAASAAASTGGSLKGTATVSAGIGPARRIGIVNNNGFDWSNCSVTLNGEWSYRMPKLAAGDHEGIMGQRFKGASGDIMTKNHQIHAVAVRCDQGSGTFTP